MQEQEDREERSEQSKEQASRQDQSTLQQGALTELQESHTQMCACVFVSVCVKGTRGGQIHR